MAPPSSLVYSLEQSVQVASRYIAPLARAKGGAAGRSSAGLPARTKDDGRPSRAAEPSRAKLGRQIGSCAGRAAQDETARPTGGGSHLVRRGARTARPGRGPARRWTTDRR